MGKSRRWVIWIFSVSGLVSQTLARQDLFVPTYQARL